MPRAMFSLRRVLTVAIPATLVAGVVPVSAIAGSSPALDPGTDTGAPIPTLDFQPCGDVGALCATAIVPLDYDDPVGETISLSVAVSPATDPANRIGTLFYNNGGPGGAAAQEVRSGVAAAFPESVRARFDIVGVDPRGVGESTPLRCFVSLESRDAVLSAPRIPTNDDEVAAALTAAQAYGAACANNAPPLLSHMSTANVARDLDLLRAAFGDEQMTYVGVSYGTHLGSVYANLFPDRVRALVLDANLDAVAWSTGQKRESRKIPFTSRIQSGIGAAETLDGFLAECEFVGPERCAFAADGSPFDKWEELRNRLRQGPVPVTLPDGTVGEVTYSNLLEVTISTLYAPPTLWGPLADALQQVYTGADLAGAMQDLDRLAAQALGTYRYADEVPFDDSFAAVVCSETDNPTDQRRFVRAAQRDERRFGAGGEFWAWAAPECATWPVKDEDRYIGPYDTPTANPILMINNVFDPATSFQSAVELQSQLANAQLLPVAGYGHVAFFTSACAADALATYVIDQVLPPVDLVCAQDAVAFSDPPPAAAEAVPAPSPADAELEPTW
jgi:pimeloyl-ACP methyl ester carboxylesterase